MIFSDEIIARIAIFFLSFAGFFVARHIWKHKNSESAPLVCPVNFDCNAVVHSNYSKFMGIHVDVFGMIYYAVMFFSYAVLAFMPESLPNLFMAGMVAIPLVAFLFSLYLIGVQIFVIKKACSWCYASAVISVLIFILTILSYDLPSLAGLFVK